MTKKPRRSCLELAAEASAALKVAGFERVSTSLRSEAVYFRLPNRYGVLRVACHPFKGGMIGLENVVATLTFRGGKGNRDSLHCDEMRFKTLLWQAIGQYVTRSVEPREIRYKGKRGTWEKDIISI